MEEMLKERIMGWRNYSKADTLVSSIKLIDPAASFTQTLGLISL
jgi:hypothetical protein